MGRSVKGGLHEASIAAVRGIRSRTHMKKTMTKLTQLAAMLFILQAGIAFAENASVKDVDRDGLDDHLEQQLLERFAPSLMIDAGDCDKLPAEFLPGSKQPVVVAQNGTIYGRVFPISESSSPTIEIHYYHLWSRDCGLLGHALDPEHVSVRVHANHRNDAAAEWRAQYWYAAAHEGTLCAASSGALASALNAEEHGASIWVSSGKHASFLSPGRCRLGCGGDSCEHADTPMRTGRVINIGEPHATMNGAVWAESGAWALPSKMKSDFNDSILERIDREESPDGIARLDTPAPPTKALILGGSSTLEALIIGNEWAVRSVVMGTVPSAESTEKALRKAGETLDLVTHRLRELLKQ